ncbi:MAG: 5'-nucleotidase C-terminal domain-containing protein, partial [Desulfotomaculum sp.]|nr:5'-nucleotidase C-terminal domain-containing protein [Desulfotomaculum sp.]
MAEYWGNWMLFRQDSTVTAHRQGFIPITAAISKRSDVENILAYYRTQLEQTLAEEIGEAAVVLDGERANVRSKETNLGNLVADVLRQKAGADIALQNGGGIRASIDVGPVTRGEVYEVLPFDNYIVALQLTGQQIWQALENGVAKYPALRGQFIQVSGIKFTFD